MSADASRLLVINADDFGLTPGVNAGMLDAHRHGLLTSVSLFAQAPATEAALALARDTPSLGVGIHLALVDGRPLLPAVHVPSLIAGTDGRLHAGWKPFIAAALRGGIDLADVERELAAQIEHLLAAGLRPTHLDSHKHVHAWPPIFAIVCRLAARYGIGVVRLPQERPWFGPAAGDLRRATVLRQAIENLALIPWSRRNGATLARHGLAARPFFGRVHTGCLTDDSLRRIIARLPPGISEVMTHAGHRDADLDALPTRLRQSREEELRLLCSPRIRGVLRDAGVRLVRHDGQPGSPIDAAVPRHLAPTSHTLADQESTP